MRFNSHPAGSALAKITKPRKPAVAAPAAAPAAPPAEPAQALDAVATPPAEPAAAAAPEGGEVHQPAATPEPTPALDTAAQAAADELKKDEEEDKGVSLDSAGEYAMAGLGVSVAASLQEWAETSDLDEGEGSADRLFGLLMGVVDADHDGEITDDEAEVLGMATELAWDYLSEKGVSDADLSALLGEWDNEAASRVQDLLAERLPDGDEASAEDIDSFVFGPADGSDEAALDAVYKKRIVIRKGKKKRINKRVSGTIRLNAKQKVAVRKAARKAHSAAATMRRARSMRVRKKVMG